MLIRSLTLATLMAFTGPLLAADDNPLKQELGKTRPLVVVELDAGNPTLATLKKQLEEAATKQSFEERSMVFYTVKFGSIGAEGEKFAKDPKDSKKLTPPETNALIRALKLGVGSGTKVILVGKDGEKKREKTVPPDSRDLKEVFSDTLKRLAKLGYPGVNNPEIVIRAALDPTTVLGQDSKVHYVVPGAITAQLPDSYNGLGFKNLVYMVVELLDLHEQWKAEEDKRAPLHLVFIEEPEAHLHAQIQQVFIRNVLRLLEDANDHATFFHTQLVVTTHSPHILYERGFSPIRYFRRVSDQLDHNTEVRNLSLFKTCAADAPAREFLQRYLKLTHCDLFFSDAVILVEGNVERLLLPAMIETAAKRLRSSALTILEVGGAFAHRFQELIAFVGLTTLVITDLDSVAVKTDAENAAEQDAGAGAGAADANNEEDDLKAFELEDDDEAAPGGKKKSKKRGSTCHAHVEGAFTSNQTLISWIPKKRLVAELWDVTAEQKTLSLAEGTSAEVRVAYQTKVLVTVGATTSQLCGRTLEEAFGLENSDWCQAEANRSVGLKLKRAPNSPEELAEKLHERVIGKNFDKTRFALEVLASGPLNCWKVPTYIAEGLAWLETKVAHEIEADAAIANEVATIEPTAAGVVAVIAGAGQTI